MIIIYDTTLYAASNKLADCLASVLANLLDFDFHHLGDLILIEYMDMQLLLLRASCCVVHSLRLSAHGSVI